jgi:hypothetical protein
MGRARQSSGWRAFFEWVIARAHDMVEFGVGSFCRFSGVDCLCDCGPAENLLNTPELACSSSRSCAVFRAVSWAARARDGTPLAGRFLLPMLAPQKEICDLLDLCPGEFALPCDALVLFVHALDAIFGFAIARKHFNHFVDTPGRISAASWVEKHSISDVEFVRWHRFPLFGR